MSPGPDTVSLHLLLHLYTLLRFSVILCSRYSCLLTCFLLLHSSEFPLTIFWQSREEVWVKRRNDSTGGQTRVTRGESELHQLWRISSSYGSFQLHPAPIHFDVSLIPRLQHSTQSTLIWQCWSGAPESETEDGQLVTQRCQSREITEKWRAEATLLCYSSSRYIWLLFAFMSTHSDWFLCSS